MDGTIKPYVIGLKVADTVPLDFEGLSASSSLPDKWAVDYEVLVGDKNIANEYSEYGVIRKFFARHNVGRFLNRTDGRLGPPVYFLVASPAYAGSPNLERHTPEDINKSLIQKHFDAKAAEACIRAQVDAVRPGEISEVLAQLRESFDTDSIDQD